MFNFGDAQDAGDKLQAHAEKLLKAGKRMLSFGGDHFVTLPLLRARQAFRQAGAGALRRPYRLRQRQQVRPRHHVLPCSERGLIDPHHSVQIGIRTEFDHDNGFTVLDAAQVNDRSVDDLLTQIKGIVGDMPVYLTFDIDCTDPAFAPGTGARR